MKRILALTLVLLMCLTAGVSAEEIRLVYAHNSNDVNNMQYTFAEGFAKRVAEETEGRVVVDVFPGGQLGGTSETLDQLKSGAVDIFQTDFANLQSYVDEVGVLSAPYIFKDAYHAIAAVNYSNSEALKQINGLLSDAAGVVFLGGFFRGARELTCSKPIYTPDDLAGLKIRSITNKLWQVMVNAMGAVATPVDWSETIQALMTNVVQGQENPVSVIYENSMNEVQDYLMMTSHIYSVLGLAVNEATWNSIGAEDQAIILKILDEMAYASVAQAEAGDAAALEKLKEAGMTVITAQDGLDVEAFRDRVVKALYENFPNWSEYMTIIQEMEYPSEG